MAQNFRNQLTHTAIGTSYTDILAQANTYDTVVGVRLVNVTGSALFGFTTGSTFSLYLFAKSKSRWS